MCTEIMIPNGTENHWAYYLDEFVNFQLRKYLEIFLNVSNLSMVKKIIKNDLNFSINYILILIF